MSNTTTLHSSDNKEYPCVKGDEATKEDVYECIKFLIDNDGSDEEITRVLDLFKEKKHEDLIVHEYRSIETKEITKDEVIKSLQEKYPNVLNEICKGKHLC